MTDLNNVPHLYSVWMDGFGLVLLLVVVLFGVPLCVSFGLAGAAYGFVLAVHHWPHAAMGLLAYAVTAGLAWSMSFISWGASVFVFICRSVLALCAGRRADVWGFMHD